MPAFPIHHPDFLPDSRRFPSRFAPSSTFSPAKPPIPSRLVDHPGNRPIPVPTHRSHRRTDPQNSPGPSHFIRTSDKPPHNGPTHRPHRRTDPRTVRFLTQPLDHPDEAGRKTAVAGENRNGRHCCVPAQSAPSWPPLVRATPASRYTSTRLSRCTSGCAYSSPSRRRNCAVLRPSMSGTSSES